MSYTFRYHPHERHGLPPARLRSNSCPFSKFTQCLNGRLFITFQVVYSLSPLITPPFIALFIAFIALGVGGARHPRRCRRRHRRGDSHR